MLIAAGIEDVIVAVWLPVATWKQAAEMREAGHVAIEAGVGTALRFTTLAEALEAEAVAQIDGSPVGIVTLVRDAPVAKMIKKCGSMLAKVE